MAYGVSASWSPTRTSAFALRGGLGYVTHQADDGNVCLLQIGVGVRR